jgi:hypothetical protein
MSESFSAGDRRTKYNQKKSLMAGAVFFSDREMTFA